MTMAVAKRGEGEKKGEERKKGVVFAGNKFSKILSPLNHS